MQMPVGVCVRFLYIVIFTSLHIKAGSGLGFSFGVRAWTEMEIRCFLSLFMQSGQELAHPVPIMALLQPSTAVTMWMSLCG